MSPIAEMVQGSAQLRCAPSLIALTTTSALHLCKQQPPAPMDQKKVEQNDKFPFHLRSQLFWFLTLPNILTYARVFVQFYACILFHNGEKEKVERKLTRNPFALAPLWALLVNQCVLDVMDGPIARKFGWCTGVGKYLDLGTDYFGFGLFLPYFAQTLAQSTDPDLPLLPLWLRQDFPEVIYMGLALYYWMCIWTCNMAAAADWKEVKYSCPITKFYYSSDLANNFLYMSYFFMLAGIYLWADGLYAEIGKSLFYLTFIPGLARAWAADWIVSSTLATTLFETDREKFLKTAIQKKST